MSAPLRMRRIRAGSDGLLGQAVVWWTPLLSKRAVITRTHSKPRNDKGCKVARILVIDGLRVVRDALATALNGYGYEVLACDNGRDALRRATEERPSLILIDVATADVDGLRVVERLRASTSTAHTPILVLTASRDRRLILRAASLGVREWILKESTTIRQLVERVAKHLTPPASASATAATQPHDGAPSRSPLSMPTPLGADETERRIARAEVKALSGAVAELISLTGSSRATLDEVASCLKRDPPLASRLLRISNSAAYASTKLRINTIEDAIKHVGLNEVNRLATSIGILETFGGGVKGNWFIRNWQHSLGVATLMARLSEPVADVIAPGLAHTIGLCRGLPSILMNQNFQEQEDQVIALAHETGRPPEQCYEQVLGMPHAKFAIALLDRAGLPAVVMTPLREYFNSFGTRPPASRTPTCSVLRLSSEFANGLMLGPRVVDAFGPFETTALRCGTAQLAPGNIDPAEFCAATAVMTGTTAGLSSEQLTALSMPPLPKRNVRVAYLRDSRFASFDPVEAMLRLTTDEVTVGQSFDAVPIALADCRVVVAATADLGGVVTSPAFTTSRQAGTRWLILSTGDTTTPATANDDGVSVAPARTSAAAIGRFIDACVSPPAAIAA